MTAFIRNPWFASTRLTAGTMLLALLLGAVGCKSKDSGGSSGGSGMTKNDPLIGGPSRIPKQNVPVPDRAATGPKNRVDPLLGSPTSSTRANAGAGYTDDPERWKKGPYVPGPGGSPASLAGRPKDDGEGLKIDAPGVGLTPVGGTLPAAPAPTLGSDATLNELAKYGVKRGDFTILREDGQVIVRVRVPIAAEGPVRSFTGQAATEAQAVKQVVDQIKSAK